MMQNLSDQQQQTAVDNQSHEISQSHTSVDHVHRCPHCGAGIHEGADICESCGKWLLTGKCHFCYADVEPGQKFCSNCGNPPEGIICPQCGTLSYFDFCPHCQTPLTEQATETIELVRNSTEIQELLQMANAPVQESSSGQQQENSSEKLARYLAKVEKQQRDESATETEELPAKSTFEKKSTFGDVSKNIEVAARAQKAADEQRQNTLLEKQQEEKTKELLQKLREKQFKDNQEARRFFGALEVVLPVLVEKKKTVKIGWLCNAYGVIHQHPQECAKAGLGGIWLYDEITEHETKLQKKTI